MQKKNYCEPILQLSLFDEKADIITFSTNQTTQKDPFEGNPFLGVGANNIFRGQTVEGVEA